MNTNYNTRLIPQLYKSLFPLGIYRHQHDPWQFLSWRNAPVHLVQQVFQLVSENHDEKALLTGCLFFCWASLCYSFICVRGLWLRSSYTCMQAMRPAQFVFELENRTYLKNTSCHLRAHTPKCMVHYKKDMPSMFRSVCGAGIGILSI